MVKNLRKNSVVSVPTKARGRPLKMVTLDKEKLRQEKKKLEEEKKRFEEEKKRFEEERRLQAEKRHEEERRLEEKKRFEEEKKLQEDKKKQEEEKTKIEKEKKKRETEKKEKERQKREQEKKRKEEKKQAEEKREETTSEERKRHEKNREDKSDENWRGYDNRSRGRNVGRSGNVSRGRNQSRSYSPEQRRYRRPSHSPRFRSGHRQPFVQRQPINYDEIQMLRAKVSELEHTISQSLQPSKLTEPPVKSYSALNSYGEDEILKLKTRVRHYQQNNADLKKKLDLYNKKIEQMERDRQSAALLPYQPPNNFPQRLPPPVDYRNEEYYY